MGLIAEVGFDPMSFIAPNLLAFPGRGAQNVNIEMQLKFLERLERALHRFHLKAFFKLAHFGFGKAVLHDFIIDQDIIHVDIKGLLHSMVLKCENIQ